MGIKMLSRLTSKIWFEALEVENKAGLRILGMVSTFRMT